MERTLVIVKPDGVKKNLIGEVIKRFEQDGLRVIGLKMLKLSKEQAQGFYQVHKDKPFFDSLTDFMSSGPIVVMVLQGERAIERVREIMGTTDPKKAAPGTIRAQYADNIQENIVHGSDSAESAALEITYFFSSVELFSLVKCAVFKLLFRF